MKYIADLHVHSKYSRATAKNLDLEHLYIYAQLKGITVVATGDFTHPAWFSELAEKLEPAEDGFFKLKPEIATACDREVPPSCRRPVRFVLSTEISNIYKKNDRTRKNHNLVLMPDMDAAARFNARLDAIGNIKSDGRPILGLDARNLLEITLETSPDAFLIPAHIWTPWFSLFGSKSGFNTIKECFEDLTPHVFAVETGLSSDPPMNWRVSDIDGLTLVSNSDAHSPSKLGREACLFDTGLSFSDMRQALESGSPDKYLGTYEFYPEEGKYHFDGHRACGISFSPDITRQHDGNCPVCGKPLTLGVLYRVEELADRDPDEKPDRHHPFYSIVPLEEVLSEILGVGPKSKKVTAAYNNVLEKIGPEFEVMYETPVEDIQKSGQLLLDIAIERIRNGDIQLTPGFDGEYGRVKVFQPEEIGALKGEVSLFSDTPLEQAEDNTCRPVPVPPPCTAGSKPARQPSLPGLADDPPATDQPADIFSGLNERQLEAVVYGDGPLMIIAGPGSGKTHTLTCRIARLLRDNKVRPQNILAITFTNRAADEMSRRLGEMTGGAAVCPRVSTFHAFCYNILKTIKNTVPVILDEADQRQLLSDALQRVDISDPATKKQSARFAEMISRAKQQLLVPGDDLGKIAPEIPSQELAAAYQAYQDLLESYGLMDFEDLITIVVNRLEADETFRKKCQIQYPYIFVDEYQDINYAQYRLIRALVPPGGNICVIGDPDQAIYGFRGSDTVFFKTFDRDYPGAATICLEKNYRSTETILSASYNVISSQQENTQRVRVYSGISGQPAITVAGLASDRAEATFVGKTIESLVGGLGFFSIDFGKAGYEDPQKAYAFSDMAILFRTRAQAAVFAEILSSAGIPCHLSSRDNMYSAAGIAELISLLRLCNDCGSMIDFKRVLSAGEGRQTGGTLDALDAWNKKHGLTINKMLSALIRFPVDGIGSTVQTRLAALAENLLDIREKARTMRTDEQLLYILKKRPDIQSLIERKEKTRETRDLLIKTAREKGADPASFLAGVSLVSDADVLLPRADRVRLMTIHAAKGLEFPVVFVAGCEDGYLPLRRSDNDTVDMDEERRLLYVAMTRARDQLYLTYAHRRRIYGKTTPRRISPFARDIESRLLASAGLGKGKKPRNGPVQMELF